MAFSERDKAIIRELQGTIPLDTLHPYEEIARRCGMSEEELLETLRAWQSQGRVRRMGAVLRHQSVGRSANAMSVWKVCDPEKTRQLAEVLAGFKEITHLYERPTAPNWPYNLYAMIHCDSMQRCREIAEEVARRTGVSDYRLLTSTKEYKKESLRYF